MHVTHFKPRKVGFHANYKISLTKENNNNFKNTSIACHCSRTAFSKHLLQDSKNASRQLWEGRRDLHTTKHKSSSVCFSRKSRRKLYISASPKKMSWQNTISVLPKLEVSIPALNEYKNCPFSGCRNQNCSEPCLASLGSTSVPVYPNERLLQAAFCRVRLLKLFGARRHNSQNASTCSVDVPS